MSFIHTSSRKLRVHTIIQLRAQRGLPKLQLATVKASSKRWTIRLIPKDNEPFHHTILMHWHKLAALDMWMDNPLWESNKITKKSFPFSLLLSSLPHLTTLFYLFPQRLVVFATTPTTSINIRCYRKCQEWIQQKVLAKLQNVEIELFASILH